MSFSEDKVWTEVNYHCKYCGNKLEKDIRYCNEDCKKKDSVWNWNDD